MKNTNCDCCGRDTNALFVDKNKVTNLKGESVLLCDHCYYIFQVDTNSTSYN